VTLLTSLGPLVCLPRSAAKSIPRPAHPRAPARSPGVRMYADCRTQSWSAKAGSQAPVDRPVFVGSGRISSPIRTIPRFSSCMRFAVRPARTPLSGLAIWRKAGKAPGGVGVSRQRGRCTRPALWPWKESRKDCEQRQEGDILVRSRKTKRSFRQTRLP